MSEYIMPDKISTGVKKKRSSFALFLEMYTGGVFTVISLFLISGLTIMNWILFFNNTIAVDERFIMSLVFAMVEILVPIVIYGISLVIISSIKRLHRLSTLPLTKEELSLLGITNPTRLLNYINFNEPKSDSFDTDCTNKDVNFEILGEEYVEMVMSLINLDDIASNICFPNNEVIPLLIGDINYDKRVRSFFEKKDLKKITKKDEVR